MEEKEIEILESLDKIENYGKKLIISYSYFDKKKEMETTIDDKYRNILKKTIENYSSEPIDKILGIKLDNKVIYSHSIKDIEINKNNIHLYYEFMNKEELETHSSLLNDILLNRFHNVRNTIRVEDKKFEPLKDYDIDLAEKSNNYIYASIFGVKDNLQPIEKYIDEIKNSDGYKNYVGENTLSSKDVLIESKVNLFSIIEENPIEKQAQINNYNRQLISNLINQIKQIKNLNKEYEEKEHDYLYDMRNEFIIHLSLQINFLEDKSNFRKTDIELLTKISEECSEIIKSENENYVEPVEELCIKISNLKPERIKDLNNSLSYVEIALNKTLDEFKPSLDEAKKLIAKQNNTSAQKLHL